MDDSDVVKFLVDGLDGKVVDRENGVKVWTFTPVEVKTELVIDVHFDLDDTPLTDEEKRYFDFLLAQKFQEMETEFINSYTGYGESPLKTLKRQAETTPQLYSENYKSAVVDKDGKVVKIID